MATGTGLDSQFGFKLETTYGTAVTVDKFLDFNEESLAWSPTWKEPTGLRPGRRFKRGSRLQQTRSMVGGDVTFPHSTRLMGTLWKLALASSVTTPTTITAPAYKQIHTPGQSVFPPSATMQVGRPEPESGTVQPHTMAGCMCTEWEFSVSDQEDAKLRLSIDGRSEATATALAASSYVPDTTFDFSDFTVFKLGGTASTGSGVVSIAGGTQVAAVVTEFTLTGSNPAATERFGLGNAGLKNGPRYNDFAGYTGSLTAEYKQSEMYTPFKANTATPLQLSAIGNAIGATGSFETLDFVIPQIRFKNVGPAVGGPDLVTQSVEFEIYDDDTNAPLQVTLISQDSTAL